MAAPTAPEWPLLRRVALDPATDGVSSVRLSPATSSVVLVTSWDGRARVYAGAGTDGGAAPAAASGETSHAAAVLCGAFTDAGGRRVASGGLDRLVRARDVERGAGAVGGDADSTVVGRHADAVRCMEAVHDQGLLVTGSWDGTVKLWDARVRVLAEPTVVQVPGRVYALDVTTERAGAVVTLAALHDGTLIAHDARRPDLALFHRPCSVGRQVRCVRVFDGGRGVLAGSIEGRVAVENFEDLASQPGAADRRYAFKCHRRDELVFPVGAIQVLPGAAVGGAAGSSSHVFATAGADGSVAVWDGAARKRFARVERAFPTSCAALDASSPGAAAADGGVPALAVAASYTFERGDVPHAPDEVLLFEVRPG